MNIEVCRISTTDCLNGGTYSGGKASALPGDDRKGKAAGRYDPDTGRLKPEDFKQPSGRWPSNVILQHKGGCRPDGIKRVKTGVAVKHNSGGYNIFSSAKKPPAPDQTYADKDGNETVARWDCEAGCSVKALDEQSGEIRSPRSYTKSSTTKNVNAFGKGIGQNAGETSVNYGDSGGASRFFKQFRSS